MWTGAGNSAWRASAASPAATPSASIWRAMCAAALDGPRLAAKIDALLAFQPRPAVLDLGGAARSAALLQRMHMAAQTSACARSAA